MPEYYQLRSDLIIQPREVDGQTFFVIKDPLTGRFFQLREPEHFLISQMDGQTAITTALTRFTERFAVSLPPQAADTFFQKMQRLCLFDGVYAEAALSGAGRRSPRGESLWARLLCWRIAAGNPERLVDRVERYTRWMFTPEFLVTALVIVGLSLATAGANQATFFPGFSAIFQLGSLLGIFMAIFVLAACHEFGHAVALRHYGGRVSEMGLMILYFQPCVYCNLSDTYLLPDRKRKTTVLLAGLYAQMLITAVAIFIWRITELGTVINRFSFLLAAVSLAIALFNLNPLIRLDGYYLLADRLNLPNLRPRAFAYLRRQLADWLFGRATNHADDRHGRVFRWYGIIAVVYSGLLIAFFGYYLTVFLALQMGLAGPLVLWGAVGLFASRPLWRGTKPSEDEVKNPPEKKNQASSSGSSSSPPPPSSGENATPATKTKRSRRPYFFWGTLVILFLLSIFIHAPHRVGSVCRVEPSAVFSVTNPEAGIIEAQLRRFGTQPEHWRRTLQLASTEFSAVKIIPRFAEGDQVYLGDTVLVISSNYYRSQRQVTDARLERAQAELNLLFSGPKQDEIRQLHAELAQVEAQLTNEQTEFERRGRMHERRLISDVEYEMARTRLAIVQQGVQAKESEISLLISAPKIEEIAIKEAEIAELTAAAEHYRSQIAASIFTAPFTGRVSRAGRGELIFQLIRTDTVRVIIPTAEADIGEVNIGATVQLKVRSYPFDRFEGRVAKLAIAAINDEETQKYEVITAIPNPRGQLLSGMTGYAKIDCGDRRVISLIFRRVIYFFRVEFWSWW